MVKCLAEYRARRYDSAVKRLQGLSPDTGGGSLDAICFAALAMAEQSRGRPTQARAALAKCRFILKERSPDPANGRWYPAEWYNWLHSRIICREAEEMIGADSG
jgi:hypothetical protein